LSSENGSVGSYETPINTRVSEMTAGALDGISIINTGNLDFGADAGDGQVNIEVAGNLDLTNNKMGDLMLGVIKASASAILRAGAYGFTLGDSFENDQWILAESIALYASGNIGTAETPIVVMTTTGTLSAVSSGGSVVIEEINLNGMLVGDIEGSSVTLIFKGSIKDEKSEELIRAAAAAIAAFALAESRYSLAAGAYDTANHYITVLLPERLGRAAAEGDVTRAQANLNGAQTAYGTAYADLAEAEAALAAIVGAGGEVELKQAEIATLETQKSDKEAELAQKQAELDGLDAEDPDYDTKLADLETEIDVLGIEIADLASEIEVAGGELAALEAEAAEIEEIIALFNALIDAEAELARIDGIIDEEAARVDLAGLAAQKVALGSDLEAAEIAKDNALLAAEGAMASIVSDGDITLTFDAGADIGQSDNALTIQLGTNGRLVLKSGVDTPASEGSIDLEACGNLTLGSAISASGDINLAATGDITAASDLSGTALTGQSASISSVSGNVGTSAASPLRTSISSISALGKKVYISNSSSAVIDRVVADEADLSIGGDIGATATGAGQSNIITGKLKLRADGNIGSTTEKLAIDAKELSGSSRNINMISNAEAIKIQSLTASQAADLTINGSITGGNITAGELSIAAIGNVGEGADELEVNVPPSRISIVSEQGESSFKNRYSDSQGGGDGDGGGGGGGSGGGAPTPPQTQTIGSEKTGITVTGLISPTAKLKVTDQLLHQQDDCSACAILKAMQQEGMGLLLRSISLTGDYEGTLTISIPVPAEYEGRTLTILYSEGSTLKSSSAVVKDGKLTFETDTLSSFLILTGANPVRVAEPMPFKDLTPADWFYAAIIQVHGHGIMRGVSEDDFAPNDSLTRGMFITMLYRLAGEPETRGEAGFEDVDSDSWYSDAVAWAVENGIAFGFDPSTFGTDADITREQMVVMMFRFMAHKGFDVGSTGDLSSYTDVSSISDWARAAFEWAVGAGQIKGTLPDVLNPAGTAIRAESAIIIWRFMMKYMQPQIIIGG
jgi:uncharacterized protein YaiE (UPF0345 family)/predicted  nucleic acid-binding Zn-ribbon protein